jgi:uncharacterized membrane protein (Fun14 family)
MTLLTLLIGAYITIIVYLFANGVILVKIDLAGYLYSKYNNKARDDNKPEPHCYSVLNKSYGFLCSTSTVSLYVKKVLDI